MPRPKVPDSQRERASEACTQCRETKKKCSGRSPCTQCTRRGLSRQCFITSLPRGSRSGGSHHRNRSAAMRLSSSRAAPPRPAPILTPMTDTARPDVGDLGQVTTNECDDSLAAPGPRMLLSSHGERVYIGAAASIAFLQIVRRVVAAQIGPSDFSHGKDSEKMLEIETPSSTDDALELTTQQKLMYLQSYFSVTEAFIDIFDPEELKAWIKDSGQGILTNASPSSRQTSPLRRASLDLVVAIGAQCKADDASGDSPKIGRAFFRGAQRQALAEMIQDPDLDMVRTYLLMAFYMLGDCRRNTAYMYLSVAVRAAIALGLHSPSSYGTGPTLNMADKVRLRVWLTCRVGDKLVNSILGRPATTLGIPEDLGPIIAKLSSPSAGSDHKLDCMLAAYTIVSIIDDINTKLYGEQEVRPEVVERLLQAIDNWKNNLPPTLRQNAAGATAATVVVDEAGVKRQERSIGVVHISCLYYFAVMLASRPMFISGLSGQGKQQSVQSSIGDACLDSALYMAQTCVEALEAGLLGSNMCIMKALVFAAGLVLGVESFAKSTVNYEIERAFNGAKQVLSYLAVQSPQASHYLDILTSLSNAIAKQRARMEPTGGRGSRYVSRLFSEGSTSTSSIGASSTTGVNSIGMLVEQQRMGDDVAASWANALLDDETAAAASSDLPPGLVDSPSRWWGGGGDDGQVDPELFVDWETVNVSHWDNFPFSV